MRGKVIRNQDREQQDDRNQRIHDLKPRFADCAGQPGTPDVGKQEMADNKADHRHQQDKQQIGHPSFCPASGLATTAKAARSTMLFGLSPETHPALTLAKQLL